MKDPTDTDIGWSVIAGAVATCVMLCGIFFGFLFYIT